MQKAVEYIARSAGKLMLEAKKDGMGIRKKDGVGNFVTDCDEAIQAFLQRELAEVLPQAAFVGEEAGGKPYRPDGCCWIVDPIDGTTNFIRSMGYSAVSIGLIQDGKPELGVVYNPFSGEMYSAKSDEGATLNGNPIHVSERRLRDAIVTFGATNYQKDVTDRMFRTLRGLFDHCEDLRQFGAASLDICRVAAGRLEAFLELRLYPWDYAAGMCILIEAGGRITTAEGEPLPFDGETSILAANDACYAEALSICVDAR